MDPIFERKLRDFVRNAVEGVPYIANRQEPQYVMALMARLRGVVYKNSSGRMLMFRTTGIDDRGAGSAENTWGADFAITVLLTEPGKFIQKASLGQAKKGPIEDLPPKEHEFLQGQLKKMRVATRDIVVAQVPTVENESMMIREVVPGALNPLIPGLPESLADYLVRMCDCKHGDPRPEFVEAVQDSSLPQLKLIYEH